MAPRDITIPEGYTTIKDIYGVPIIVPTYMVNDGHTAILPEFLQPAIEQDMMAQKIKAGLTADLKNREPFKASAQDGPMQGEGLVMVPVNPSLNDAEILSLHAEVQSLQTRYGLSYKDAAHRLYLAEVEKLKAQHTAQNMLHAIREDIIIARCSLLKRKTGVEDSQTENN